MAELNKEFPEQAKGAELSDEALDSVAGGWVPFVPPRPWLNSRLNLPPCSCGSTSCISKETTSKLTSELICERCNKRIGYRKGIHEAGRNYIVIYDANGNEVSRT